MPAGGDQKLQAAEKSLKKSQAKLRKYESIIRQCLQGISELTNLL